VSTSQQTVLASPFKDCLSQSGLLTPDIRLNYSFMFNVRVQLLLHLSTYLLLSNVPQVSIIAIPAHHNLTCKALSAPACPLPCLLRRRVQRVGQNIHSVQHVLVVEADGDGRRDYDDLIFVPAARQMLQIFLVVSL
jgi:hypothetical protein